MNQENNQNELNSENNLLSNNQTTVNNNLISSNSVQEVNTNNLNNNTFEEQKIENINQQETIVSTDSITPSNTINKNKSYIKIITIITILLALIVFCVIILISNDGFKSLFNKSSNDKDKFDENSIIIPEGDKKYSEGIFYKSEINILEVFNLDFPDGFVEQSYDNIIEYTYPADSDYMGCTIRLFQLDDITSGEGYIKQRRDYESPGTPLNRVKVNNITWITYEEKYSGVSYIYGTTIKNEPYIMDFHIYENEYKNDCLLFKDKIANIVSLK